MQQYYYLIIFTLCFTLFILINKFPVIIINLSSSMPKGLYVKKFSPLQRGDIVAVCLNENLQKLALISHYLRYGNVCQQTLPVIKKIIAIPGDNVLLTSNTIAVNDHVFSYPTLTYDHHGRKLAKYPRDYYPATTGYWLIGSNSHSWDSRYWGPVKKSQIIANLRIVIAP